MAKMVKCAACQSRKGKRQCPALGNLICPVCCGTKRQKEIQCTPDCVYLGKAKATTLEKKMSGMWGHESKHLDVLQNIEFSIFQVYRDTSSITDREVENVMDYLIEKGKADMGAGSGTLPGLLPHEENLVDAIENIFKVRKKAVGRDEAQTEKLQCFARILESVKLHRSPHNTCSYLNFIGQFLR